MTGPLAYDNSHRPLDAHYDTSQQGLRLRDDPAMQGTGLQRLERLPALFTSDDWRDRVRAGAILASLKDRVTLPGPFPAIMETADSAFRESRVWVAHPDVTVLVDVLPEYQAMWDGYTAQWGPAARREFVVVHVENVSVASLIREECGPDDILRSAAATHDFWAHVRQELRPEVYRTQLASPADKVK